MFEPRPEIRMATRLRSGMMDRGPVLRGVPVCAAVYGTTAGAGFDAADRVHCFASAFEETRDFRGIGCVDDGDHADAAVERTRHLLRRNAATVLQKGEDGR